MKNREVKHEEFEGKAKQSKTKKNKIIKHPYPSFPTTSLFFFYHPKESGCPVERKLT
jgi:hypothetical protein